MSGAAEWRFGALVKEGRVEEERIGCERDGNGRIDEGAATRSEREARKGGKKDRKSVV